MKNIKMLTVGDKVTLNNVIDNEIKITSSVREIKYPSKLVDIISDEILVVTVPNVSNGYLNMLHNQEYEISVFTKSTILQSRALVMRVYKENNIKLVTLRLLSNLQQFQRRSYYRMPCTIDMSYKEISPLEQMLIKRIEDETKHSLDRRNEKENPIIEMCKEALIKLQRHSYSGVISDLSGGGIRFHSNVKHNIYDKYRVKFHIYNDVPEDFFELDVCIVGAKKNSNKPLQYEYRANFVSISEDEREKIIRDIFKIECENRKIK